jgi:Holliday junction resolvasome RuvABC endonuclease subunit
MDKAWSEVGNWSLDANMSPKLDKALTAFANRIDDELFQRFERELICIVDCAIARSTTLPLDVACAPHSRKLFKHQVYVIAFRPEVERLSDRATLGEVAHAFAHLALRINQRMDTETIPTGEDMADALAISWGFKEEIDLNLAEWQAIDETTRGRGHARKW